MPCEALTMRQFKKESTVLLRNNMGAQPSFQKRLLVDFLIRRYLLEGLSFKILANYWFEWDIMQEHRCFFSGKHATHWIHDKVMDTKVKMANQSCSTSSGLRKQKIMSLKKIEVN